MGKINLNTNIKEAYEKHVSEHCSRLTILSKEFGLFLGLDSNILNDLVLSACFHDIGKIYVPLDILSKPGKLTKEEYEIIKEHSYRSYQICKHCKMNINVSTIVLCHHERIDGTGYPYGLKGDTIPYISKIISILDAYDVIVNDRPYKSAETKECAIEELKKHSGTQFDSELVNKFIKFISDN